MKANSSMEVPAVEARLYRRALDLPGRPPASTGHTAVAIEQDWRSSLSIPAPTDKAAS